MVMELAEKGSLDKVLRNQNENLTNKNENLTWKQRMEIALDAINGIKYLHEQKIVHRDIKSGNVLIDGNFRAKISDFGIAKEKKNQQVTKSLGHMGTLSYMAPELFKTSTKYTNESDIYAFGIVLWELMENGKPGKKLENFDEDKEDWFSDIEKFKVEDREEISESSITNHPKLCELIRECWKFEEKERPSEDKIIAVLKNELNNGG